PGRAGGAQLRRIAARSPAARRAPRRTAAAAGPAAPPALPSRTSGRSLEHRVAAPGMVEADQVARAVSPAAVEVRAHLGDQPVAEQEPFGAAVEPPLAAVRIAPGHRPLDHGLVALLDPVVEVPLALEVLD